MKELLEIIRDSDEKSFDCYEDQRYMRHLKNGYYCSRIGKCPMQGGKITLYGYGNNRPKSATLCELFNRLDIEYIRVSDRINKRNKK